MAFPVRKWVGRPLATGILSGVGLLGLWASSGFSVAHAQDDVKGPVRLPVMTPVVLFDNFNVGGVVNGPSSATTFSLATGATITAIRTYHWNNGRGAVPATLALQSADGKKYGPWQAVGIAGQGGVKNAFWEVRISAVVPAGTYTILDSNTMTWSYNAASKNQGFAHVDGRPAR